MPFKGLIKSLPLIVGLLLVVSAPVWLAVRVADQQSLQAETSRAMDYANEVLHKSEAVADQVQVAINRLIANAGHSPCSPSNQLLMHEIDLESSYLQAIGHVEDNRMVCSSMGIASASIPLGPPDWMAPRKVGIRNRVTFPFAPNIKFAVIERAGYAAIVHLAIPVDVSDAIPGLSLATLSIPANRVLTQRGDINPDWIARLDVKHTVQFIQDDRIVVLVPSQTHALAAIAALPLDRVRQQEKVILGYLIPAALITGLLLCIGLLYLLRSQQGMPGEIRAALRNNEFHLLYQPIVDAATGRWISAEALIRWTKTNGEKVRPDLFIPIAEETGLITQITERVIKLLQDDAKGLFSRHPGFCISLNLSAADLQRSQTLVLLKHLVDQTDAAAGNLSVEITERSLINPDAAKKTIDELRAFGFKVALDDFGTGYSSLSTLAGLSLDYIKIDRSFVEAIGTEAPTQHVVRHIVELARGLDIDLIAEGVETEVQRDQLQQLGVNQMQGWLFARAIPMKALLEKIPAR